MSATGLNASRFSFFTHLIAAAFLVILIAAAAPLRAQENSADPILKAMREELDRSKSQLKMENVAAPYYIEYRVSDVDQYDAEAAFGALRQEQRMHARSLRVVVRVGDYKQDSYYGPGTGVVSFAPLDNDSIALRRELWIATDRAYKSASEALASKKALLSQYTADQPFEDFARAPALQMIAPLVQPRFPSRTVEGGDRESHRPLSKRRENRVSRRAASISRREPIFCEHRRHQHQARVHGLLAQSFRADAGG